MTKRRIVYMTATQSQENVITTNTRVLVIGGSGKVASIAIPQYADDYEITAMLRREEKAEEAIENGATPLVQDVTTVSADQWAALVRDFDVVVWTAGNGGRAGADVTYAVDRDAALECIKGLEKVQDEVGKDRAPRLIMVSYMGSLDNETDDEGAWLAYVESKKTVDKRLLDSDLNYIILAPTLLTLDPAQGISVTENTPEKAGEKTSRELVGQVIFELAGRTELPNQDFIAFHDGSDPVSAI